MCPYKDLILLALWLGGVRVLQVDLHFVRSASTPLIARTITNTIDTNTTIRRACVLTSLLCIRIFHSTLRLDSETK
jgi:hypothetical protein